MLSSLSSTADRAVTASTVASSPGEAAPLPSSSSPLRSTAGTDQHRGAAEDEGRYASALATVAEERDALTARVQLLASKVSFADRALQNAAAVVAAVVQERDTAVAEAAEARAQVQATQRLLRDLQQQQQQQQQQGEHPQPPQPQQPKAVTVTDDPLALTSYYHSHSYITSCQECSEKSAELATLRDKLRDKESVLLDLQVWRCACQGHLQWRCAAAGPSAAWSCTAYSTFFARHCVLHPLLHSCPVRVFCSAIFCQRALR